MSKAINIALGIGIAIILVLVVTLGIKTFYSGPERNEFCAENMYEIDNQIACTAGGGKWMQGSGSDATPGSCIPDKCDEDYDTARNIYGRNIFFIANLIGILLVMVSLFIMSMMNISAGIAFAGIALIVYGFIVGWEGTDDIWKFSIGIVIAILLIISAVLVNKKVNEK